MKRLFGIMLMLMALSVGAQPMPETAEPPVETPDTKLTVSLLTCAPGREVYELEGHSALRFRQGADDVVVNWGVFDFNAPNFVYRFVSGHTDYRCALSTFSSFIGSYAREERQVTEQVLNVSPCQARKMLELTLENLRPENATYRYNYVLDNCATRPLGIIREACGDSLLLRPQEIASTFRKEMAYFHQNYPWYQFGIDLALGSGIDRPISPLERAFAPVTLEKIVASSKILEPDGAYRPLVGETEVLVAGRFGGVVEKPTPWPLSPDAVAAYVFVIALSLTIIDFRRGKLSRWFDSILFGCYGLAGLVLTFLIFVSVHEATSPNWLYLWLNPLCWVAAVGIWLKRHNIVVYSYQILNFALLTLLLVGQKWHGQAFNSAFTLLILCDMLRAATYIYLYRCSKKNHAG